MSGRIPAVVFGALGIAFLGGILLFRHFFTSESSGQAKTNASLAHDPAKSRRAPRVYREEVDGHRYLNRDLGLALAGPQDWTVALGKRSEDAEPYEGLVVKMEPDGPVDPVTQVRPLVSVVKRSLAAGAARDALSYINKQLLDPKKTLTDPPEAVEVAGRPMGRVAYEMPSGQGSIKVLQYVYVRQNDAIVFSTMAPAENFGGLSHTFEGVVASLRLDADSRREGPIAR